MYWFSSCTTITHIIWTEYKIHHNIKTKIQMQTRRNSKWIGFKRKKEKQEKKNDFEAA